MGAPKIDHQRLSLGYHLVFWHKPFGCGSKPKVPFLGRWPIYRSFVNRLKLGPLHQGTFEGAPRQAPQPCCAASFAAPVLLASRAKWPRSSYAWATAACCAGWKNPPWRGARGAWKTLGYQQSKNSWSARWSCFWSEAVSICQEEDTNYCRAFTSKTV